MARIPTREVYTLVAKTGLVHITAIRLEALPDPSLPENGPGRCPDCGDFYLNELRVLAGGKASTLTNIIVTDDKTEEFRNVIDGRIDESRGWSSCGRAGETDTAIVATGLERAPDDDLKIELHFSRLAGSHNIGRFRLSVTGDPDALEAEQRRIPFKLKDSELADLDVAIGKVKRLKDGQATLPGGGEGP